MLRRLSSTSTPPPYRPFKTITIFGATGFLGRYVVNALGRYGWQVHIATRGDDMEWRHLKPLCDLGMLVPHYFSAKDQASVDACVPPNADAVLNLIGKRYETKHVLPWWINNTFEDTNIHAARAVALAARKADAKHLVHVSCARASKDAPSRWARTKAEGEAVVRAEFPGACIVRPGAMYGEQDTLLNWFASRKWGPLLLANGGQTTLKPVWVNDVALALAQIVLEPQEFCNANVDLLGNDTYTQRQIAEYVYTAIGIKKTLGELPQNAIVDYGVRLLESLPKPIVTRDDLELAKCADQPVKDALTFADLKIQPKSFESKAFTFLFRYRRGGHFIDMRRLDKQVGPGHVSHLVGPAAKEEAEKHHRPI